MLVNEIKHFSKLIDCNTNVILNGNKSTLSEKYANMLSSLTVFNFLVDFIKMRTINNQMNNLYRLSFKGTGYASLLWQQIFSKRWKFTLPILILHTKEQQQKTKQKNTRQTRSNKV
jgi:hypothetical protein